MKIVCEKDTILKAINSVTKAVASKTTMPILEGILIQTNDKEVKFTTYEFRNRYRIYYELFCRRTRSNSS